ncbi:MULTISPECIES: Ltp family lipoprotein [unclassified Isoptericola]|uniref:Ltp family lipoprotein n=1 Tax=unclassified Isoptericola TaxID=2623355 RepID=UPI0036581A20
MTDQFPPPAQPTDPSPEQPPSQAELNRRAREAKATAKANKNWFARHKVLTGVGVIAAVSIAGTAIGGGGDEDPATAEAPAAAAVEATDVGDDLTAETADENTVEDADVEEPSTEQAAEEKTAKEPATKEPATKEVADGPTVAQQNALESAQSYLEYSGFSKQGLLDQLTSEYGDGFETADATWAIKHVDADWKAEAVESAESYLEYDSFSRSGLIDQLSSEYGDQYTRAQAEYAADQVGL